MKQQATTSTLIRESLRQQLENLRGDVAELKESSVDGCDCFELRAKASLFCPLTVCVVGEGRYDLYVGIHGRFEYLKLNSQQIIQFIQAVLRGDVVEDVWLWNGKPLKVVTQVKTKEETYVQKWSSIARMIVFSLLQPWIEKQQRRYEPYCKV